MNYSLIALVFMGVLPSSAFAQKEVTPASLFAKCENYLQCAFEIAEKKAAFWKNEMSRISELGAEFKPCDFDRANTLHQYYDWMRKNREELLRVEALLTGVNEQIRIKVSEIQSRQLEVGAVEGQSQSSYSLAFTQIAAYLKNLNERLSKLSADQVPSLMRVQENYLSNKLGVAHSQIIAAIELTNAGINASLKEKNSSFAVELVQQMSPSGAKVFDYVLKYRGEVLGQKISLDVSLLNASTNEVKGMNEAEKWKALTASRLMVGGQHLDGQLRYSILRAKLGDPTCVVEGTERPMFSMAKLPLVTEETYLKASNGFDKAEFCLMPIAELVAFLNTFRHYRSFYVADKGVRVWAEFYSTGSRIRVSRPIVKVYEGVSQYDAKLVELMRNDFKCSELEFE